MDASETAQELHKIRQRMHDIAEVVHQHGAKIEINKIELVNLKEAVETIVETHATREQVKSESAILQVKLDQVSGQVSEIKGSLNKVTFAVILAVIAAVMSTVLIK